MRHPKWESRPFVFTQPMNVLLTISGRKKKWKALGELVNSTTCTPAAHWNNSLPTLGQSFEQLQEVASVKLEFNTMAFAKSSRTFYQFFVTVSTSILSLSTQHQQIHLLCVFVPWCTSTSAFLLLWGPDSKYDKASRQSCANSAPSD